MSKNGVVFVAFGDQDYGSFSRAIRSAGMDYADAADQPLDDLPLELTYSRRVFFFTGVADTQAIQEIVDRV